MDQPGRTRLSGLPDCFCCGGHRLRRVRRFPRCGLDRCDARDCHVCWRHPDAGHGAVASWWARNRDEETREDDSARTGHGSSLH